jgi:hypothetical protein
MIDLLVVIVIVLASLLVMKIVKVFQLSADLKSAAKDHSSLGKADYHPV